MRNEVKVFVQQNVRTHWDEKKKNGISPFLMLLPSSRRALIL